MLFKRSVRLAAAATLAALLAACGGGGGSSDAGPAPKDVPATKSEASRFLAQATFGPNQTELDRLSTFGYGAWWNWQFNTAATTSHLAFVDQRIAQLQQGQGPDQNWIHQSFWRAAAAGEDQLRQKVAYALSQIFVISLANDQVANEVRGVANYMDMLSVDAFGNFRKLIEDVSLNPMMGIYLSSLHNQKEDSKTGRMPDENYAREVMQLFTIGLYELNMDGTVKLDAKNEPIETYTIADITGLAKVFTGFSWGGPDKSNSRFFGGTAAPNRSVIPMQGYPNYHSTSEKKFLTVTIPAAGTADPEGDLKIALDALFNHPNVGPFIGKQLIQRLVTSNPSPAYVARVAATFNDNGSGVRGDLKAVVQAVLTDPEATDVARAMLPSGGKIREPILRMTAWMRAFNVKSNSGNFLIASTDDPNGSLGQTPMHSPTVFNFYRPGYVPPNTAIADANLVAPELQMTNETSVAGYLNLMRSVVNSGIGSNSPRDVQPDYANELALAGDPDALIDRVNLLLMSGTMSSALKSTLKDAIGSVAIPAAGGAAADTARRNRVLLAVFLTLAAPEFIVQK